MKTITIQEFFETFQGSMKETLVSDVYPHVRPEYHKEMQCIYSDMVRDIIQQQCIPTCVGNLLDGDGWKYSEMNMLVRSHLNRAFFVKLCTLDNLKYFTSKMRDSLKKIFYDVFWFRYGKYHGMQNAQYITQYDGKRKHPNYIPDVLNNFYLYEFKNQLFIVNAAEPGHLFNYELDSSDCDELHQIYSRNSIYLRYLDLIQEMKYDVVKESPERIYFKTHKPKIIAQGAQMINQYYKKAAPKIYEWAVDCFLSPYTKIGKKRLLREYESLSNM